MTSEEILASFVAYSIEEMTLSQKIKLLTIELEKSREEKIRFFSMYQDSLKTTNDIDKSLLG